MRCSNPRFENTSASLHALAVARHLKEVRMLTMFRFMNRENGRGELEPIVRFQKIDFPLGHG